MGIYILILKIFLLIINLIYTEYIQITTHIEKYKELIIYTHRHTINFRNCDEFFTIRGF